MSFYCAIFFLFFFFFIIHSFYNAKKKKKLTIFFFFLLPKKFFYLKNYFLLHSKNIFYKKFFNTYRFLSWNKSFIISSDTFLFLPFLIKYGQIVSRSVNNFLKFFNSMSIKSIISLISPRESKKSNGSLFINWSKVRIQSCLVQRSPVQNK